MPCDTGNRLKGQHSRLVARFEAIKLKNSTRYLQINQYP